MKFLDDIHSCDKINLVDEYTESTFRNSYPIDSFRNCF